MANMTFGVNLIPKTDNTYSLGDSDHRWNIYGNKIGGRNLTLNSSNSGILKKSAVTNTYFSPAFGYTSTYGLNNYAVENIYTVSFDYSVTGIDTEVNGKLGLRTSTSGWTALTNSPDINLPIGDSSGHYSHTFTMTSAHSNFGNCWMIVSLGNSGNANAKMIITNFKFEIGNLATDWTPAPEDDDAYKIYYGVCSTAAATQVKEVTIDGITSLYNGLQVRIRFDHAQNYDGQPTLNINSLGAKGITIRRAVAASNYMWNTGEILDFVYDGTNFVGVDQTYASTTYYGQTKLLDSTSSTSTVLAATPNSVKRAYDLANTAATQNITMTRLPLISRTYYPEMQVGGIDTSTGENSSSTNTSGKARSRAVNLIPYHSGTVSAETNYSYMFILYNSDGSFNSYVNSWYTGEQEIPSCGYYRLLVKHSTITDFTGVANDFITITDYDDIQGRFDLLFANMPISADGVAF